MDLSKLIFVDLFQIVLIISNWNMFMHVNIRLSKRSVISSKLKNRYR